ncbi:DUF6879 family protein [Streptomyces sp. SID3343]|uniref:DUF6879 family protein n=1 Tax=Streptomyces sp. SID3343 TaxID=2690260 RepID=UPI0013718745|nr:DUF6879 family protein [Streptomyces sp. SID3343]MYV99237.1 hypothetical protein [Streptomyces sp. SID3343]
MARRLRYVGTNSGNNGCPTLYEDLDTGEFVVQGTALIDPADTDQLRNVEPHEGLVAVPRELLAMFGPKDAERVPVIIGFDEFDAMFETFEHTAWRLETRRAYRDDEVTDTYRRFVDGQPADYDLDDAWCASRREQSAQGKRFERVRIMDNPPTIGQLYLLDGARRNAAVGETVRSLWRADAERLQLPREDFWLFDSRVLACLLFDGDALVGVELVTDPVEVGRACQIRDAAWHHALPFEEFATQVTSAM